jgi:uncharacterized protein (TIGR03086 family)
MGSDLLDSYAAGSRWTLDLVKGATGQLDAPTPCDEWDVRTLLNHVLETQRYFAGSARGEDVSPPGPTPPDLLSDEPVADFAAARDALLEAFRQPGVLERTGPLLGIALADQLLHGWDVGKATGQDTTMPSGLAEAAYKAIHGMFTDEQRKGVFKPAVEVDPDASAQDRLLGYTGRDPSS